MKFTPKSAEEIALDGLLPEGKYPFEIVKAEETTSKKSGAPMLKLQLRVFGPGNREAAVYDYIMESVADRLYKFCLNVGLADKYQSGELEAYDCEGRSGWAHVKVQPAKDGYDPKNIIGYYCKEPEPGDIPPPVGAVKGPRPAAFPEGSEDEIPF